jgi:hypothetical protein
MGGFDDFGGFRDRSGVDVRMTAGPEAMAPGPAKVRLLPGRGFARGDGAKGYMTRLSSSRRSCGVARPPMMV